MGNAILDTFIPAKEKYGYVLMQRDGQMHKRWVQLHSHVLYEGEWMKVCINKPNGQIAKVWYTDSHVNGEWWHTAEDMNGQYVGELSVLDVSVWSD